MRIIDLLTNLDISARFFIVKTPSHEYEALLVDFINFIGAKCCVDYGMYTSDLKKPINVSEWVAWDIKTTDWLKVQMSEYTILARESIIRNKHMNETNGIFELPQSELETILNKFINFATV